MRENMGSEEKDRQYFVRRWSDPEFRPKLSGKLINVANGCKCAQGDVLSECGYGDVTLAFMEQYEADHIVAEILGISIYHSVLLRTVNDSRDGCPQDVIDLEGGGIKNILGPNHKTVLAFWRYLCMLSESEWVSVHEKVNSDAGVMVAEAEEVIIKNKYEKTIDLPSRVYSASFRPTLYLLENATGHKPYYSQCLVGRAAAVATLEIINLPNLGLNFTSYFGISDPEKDLTSYMID